MACAPARRGVEECYGKFVARAPKLGRIISHNGFDSVTVPTKLYDRLLYEDRLSPVDWE